MSPVWLQGFILSRSCTWYHLFNQLILVFQIIIYCGSILAEMENLQPQLPIADKTENLWDSKIYSQATLWDLDASFGEIFIDTDYSGSIIFSLTNVIFFSLWHAGDAVSLKELDLVTVPCCSRKLSCVLFLHFVHVLICCICV